MLLKEQYLDRIPALFLSLNKYDSFFCRHCEKRLFAIASQNESRIFGNSNQVKSFYSIKNRIFKIYRAFYSSMFLSKDSKSVFCYCKIYKICNIIVIFIMYGFFSRFCIRDVIAERNMPLEEIV